MSVLEGNFQQTHYYLPTCVVLFSEEHCSKVGSNSANSFIWEKWRGKVLSGRVPTSFLLKGQAISEPATFQFLQRMQHFLPHPLIEKTAFPTWFWGVLRWEPLLFHTTNWGVDCDRGEKKRCPISNCSNWLDMLLRALSCPLRGRRSEQYYWSTQQGYSLCTKTIT